MHGRIKFLWRMQSISTGKVSSGKSWRIMLSVDIEWLLCKPVIPFWFDVSCWCKHFLLWVHRVDIPSEGLVDFDSVLKDIESEYQAWKQGRTQKKGRWEFVEKMSLGSRGLRSWGFRKMKKEVMSAAAKSLARDYGIAGFRWELRRSIADNFRATEISP